MKVLICPDKFKGSLTAIDVARSIEDALPQSFEKELVPMADGGEGSLEVIAANMTGCWKTVVVNDPLFRPVSAKYYLCQNSAYIEMAKASGYELLNDTERDCTKTSTFGTGELIKDARNEGVENIYLFIGGSATNDGGIGVAAALGFMFLDIDKNVLKPIGENLAKIHDIKLPVTSIENTNFTVVCDVVNPFYGSNGAAYVYAAQKGASPAQIIELDKGLENLANKIKTKFDIDLQSLAGAGAAGGLGGGAVAFLKAKIKSGTKTLIEITGLENKIVSSDLIITGEGKVDSQSISGKLIDGICKIAKANEIPVWIICGISEIDEQTLAKLGVKKVISLVNEYIKPAFAIKNAKSLIKERIQSLF